MTHRILPYGDRAWLIECPGDPVAAAAALESVRWPVPFEVVVGAATCLVRFDGPLPEPSAVQAVLDSGRASAPAAAAATVTVEVTYDGADLSDVARATGLTPEAVVRLHTGATYRAAFLGFAPGFAYLTGLSPQLQLPRRSVPRTRVPAGSVAIADQYTAVYPTQSPGGWHLLGRTNEPMFQLDRIPPSRLQPGSMVRFVMAP